MNKNQENKPANEEVEAQESLSLKEFEKLQENRFKVFKKKYLDRPLQAFFILLGIGLVLGAFFLNITRDVSLPYKVWLNGSHKQEYKQYDYVYVNYVNLADDILPRIKMIKQITCGPKDLLEVKDDEFFCNGVFLCRTVSETRDGKPLTPAYSSGTKIEIPDNKYFIMGTHERSYDSRYFGLVPIDMIEYEVIPLNKLIDTKLSRN